MGLLASLCNIGDWLSPLLAMVDDTLHAGPFSLDVYPIHIPLIDAANNGWSSSDIAALLAAYGFDVWGGFDNFGCYRINVPAEQGQQAAYLLNCYGIPWEQ